MSWVKLLSVAGLCQPGYSLDHLAIRNETTLQLPFTVVDISGSRDVEFTRPAHTTGSLHSSPI